MFLANRYTHLLISLVALLVLSPFLLKAEMSFPIMSFLFLVIILLTLRALEMKESTFLIIAILATLAFLLEVFFNFHIFRVDRKLISIISLSSFAIFIGISILIMINNIFSQKIVNADSVRGGISVYLLIGLLWGILYEIVAVIDPKAFVLVTGSIVGGDFRYLLFYLSFTTLTTVAFGDILPANEIARVLAAMEATSGVLFVAVFVAQLVSLHVFHKTVAKQSVQPQPKGE